MLVLVLPILEYQYQVVVSTTLSIVLVSTILMGAAVEPLLHAFKLTAADAGISVTPPGFIVPDR